MTVLSMFAMRPARSQLPCRAIRTPFCASSKHVRLCHRPRSRTASSTNQPGPNAQVDQTPPAAIANGAGLPGEPGFQPPEGERALWWVEKYEARRRAMAAASSPSTPTDAVGSSQSDASSTTSPSHTPSPDLDASTSGVAASATELPADQGKPAGRPGAWAVAASTVQLLLVNAALILWPASRQPGGLVEVRVWLLYVVYVAFFLGGTLHRLSQHGKLAPRSADCQVTSSWSSRLSFIAFVLSMPLLHWLPVLRYIGSSASLLETVTAYDLLGGAAVVGATALNWVAARQLGKAYDRVVAPEALVTTGVYRFIQHPIYTSYMLLFCGYCLCLHSAPSAMLMLLVCGLYYSQRCKLEAQVLRTTFGARYESWARATKSFIPFLW